MDNFVYSINQYLADFYNTIENSFYHLLAESDNFYWIRKKEKYSITNMTMKIYW